MVRHEPNCDDNEVTILNNEDLLKEYEKLILKAGRYRKAMNEALKICKWESTKTASILIKALKD
jgi:hypothetical protein